MSRGFRLAAVLRARKAQESAAKAAVRAARSAEQAAADRRDERERSLVARPSVDGGPAPWFMAAMASRQALAAEVRAAARYAEEVAADTAAHVTDLTDAAIRRRTVEVLAERHAAARTEADLAADQRAVDEVASNRRPTGEDLP